MNCNNCQIEFYADGMPVGRDFACARCGSLNTPDWDQGKSIGERPAWLSLGLGVGSVVLLLASIILFFVDAEWWIMSLCLASFGFGVAAVWLGIRSLLKMRYRRVQPSLRIFAVIGTVVGGVFGICLAGCISFITLLVAGISWSMEEFKGPEASLGPSSEMIELQLPDGLDIQPWQVRRSAFMFNRIDYRDTEDLSDSQISMRLNTFPQWTTSNKKQFLEMTHDDIYDRYPRKLLKQEAAGKLEWNLVGSPRKVHRKQWNLKDDDAEQPEQAVKKVMQYYSLFDHQQRTFALLLIHEPEQSKLDEDQIRQIFESIEIPGS